MMKRKTRYNTMSIEKGNGHTYWHKSFKSIEEAKAHCERYVHNYCDILVYDISGYPIKFVEMWEDWSPKSWKNLPPIKVKT